VGTCDGKNSRRKQGKKQKQDWRLSYHHQSSAEIEKTSYATILEIILKNIVCVANRKTCVRNIIFV
jgi:hypothetical protein